MQVALRVPRAAACRTKDADARWSLVKQTRSPPPLPWIYPVRTWTHDSTLRLGFAFRCRLDGSRGYRAWCLIQVIGALCLAAANLILLLVRCSSDPKGKMRPKLTAASTSVITCVDLCNAFMGHTVIQWCLLPRLHVLATTQFERIYQIMRNCNIHTMKNDA